MISIQEALKITNEKELLAVYRELSHEIETRLAPLNEALNLDISNEVAKILPHATFVQSYRSLLVDYAAIMKALLNIAKGHLVLPDKKENGHTDKDREAYVKSISSVFVAMEYMLEEKIRCVDERINLCKRMLGLEVNA